MLTVVLTTPFRSVLGGMAAPDPAPATAAHLVEPHLVEPHLAQAHVVAVGRAAGRLAGDVVQMQPSTSALPGGNVLQTLINGLGAWALALALVGLVIGAAAWALGSHGQNYQQSYVGRRAVVISGLAALLIGAGPGIVNFFFNTGTGVHSAP